MDHREFLRKQASKGGKSGKGKSKRRGDSEYYRQLAKRRKPKNKTDCTCDS